MNRLSTPEGNLFFLTPVNLPFKISTLLFLENRQGKLLLIRRNRSPNKGCWSPPGGKLEMPIGESPVECARRECLEETGLAVSDAEIHLFAYVSEKQYEGNVHWLMFLARVLRPLEALPPSIDEGTFGFFDRREIENLHIPPTDHHLVWPFYDGYRHSFVGVRADCSDSRDLRIVVETTVPPV